MVEDWDRDADVIVKLAEGTTQLTITGVPSEKDNKFGKTQYLFPTDLGIWPVNKGSGVANAIINHKRRKGTIIGARLVIERTGEGMNTRYKVVSIMASKEGKL